MINKNITILVGKSGCGKNYISDCLISNYKFYPIISYTSREPRPNEVNGCEYYFTTTPEFINMIHEDRLIEYRTYNTLVDNIPATWYYGLAKQELDDDKDYVVILDVQGTIDFVEYYGRDKCKVVYIHCDDDIRKERAMARGGYNSCEYLRRLGADSIDFAHNKLTPIVDKFVDNTNTNIDDLVKEIME